MTKPLTPTLAICLAASAVMVGALFAGDGEPKSMAYDDTTASESAEPTPITPSPDALFSPTPTTQPVEPDVQTTQPDPSVQPSLTPSTQPTPTLTPTTPTTTAATPTTPTTQPTESTTTPEDDESDDDGTDGGGSGGTITPSPDPVHITGMSIGTIRAAPGARVKVFNDDDEPHTVTQVGGGFSTGTIPAGEFRTFKAPEDTGNYDVYCELHDGMTGTLRVRD